MGKPNAPLLGKPAKFGDIGLISEGCDGLTIRQYFMAHAPAEPQSWFVPKTIYHVGELSYRKAQCIQWPAAWADAVLAAGEK